MRTALGGKICKPALELTQRSQILEGWENYLSYRGLNTFLMLNDHNQCHDNFSFK